MIIQELGKGNSIVVIDRSIYNKRMELMLNDLSKFHIIKHVPYNKKKKFWLKITDLNFPLINRNNLIAS